MRSKSSPDGDRTGFRMKGKFDGLTTACSIVCVAIALGTSNVSSLTKVDCVVAKDGSGQFRTIQEALKSIPRGNARLFVVLIKKGIYHEKIFLTESHVALVGEDRENTRIEYAELRSNWTQAADNRRDGTLLDRDWGSAVVNIGDSVTDVVIAHLTVHNTFGSETGNHEHQFGIRGFNATRIALLDCTVAADGGDTVSLWNRDSGMYYHWACAFEGWVDFVCPRGWCYATNCTFFGHDPTASIWHDGSRNKEQKFVVRYSAFDGVPGFRLGRHHRDAQFYLLDCSFSKNMADEQIYSPKSPNVTPWIWGPRHYYDNCHRQGGDFTWFSNNLDESAGSPGARDITARWTFSGAWDPEMSLPSVLPTASIPIPSDGEGDVPDKGTLLHWIPGRDCTRNIVYMGDSTSQRLVSSGVGSSSRTGILRDGREYVWRVDTVTPQDTLRGPLWRFRVSDAVETGRRAHEKPAGSN